MQTGNLTTKAILLFFVSLGISAGSLIAYMNFTQKEETAQLDETAVEKIVYDYLIKNPAILFEVQEAFEQQQLEELEEQQKEILTSSQEELLNAAYHIEFGDPNAEVTVIELFDYNCGFCQRALADMEQILSTNNKVRFILKEFPVLGEASYEASRVSMALSKVLPEKHGEFHIQLLSMDGLKDGQRAFGLALEMGADESLLLQEMDNPEILGTIQSTHGLATQLGISGTPSYIISDKVIPGAVGLQELERVIEAVNS